MVLCRYLSFVQLVVLYTVNENVYILLSSSVETSGKGPVY